MTGDSMGVIAHTLDRLIVVPRNGYVNRLQAWASSAILAAELDVPLRVVWEPEPAAPAAAADLFAPGLLERSFVTPESLTQLLGSTHQHQPRYLTVDPERRTVVLAGHDRGEQEFIPPLLGSLADPSHPTTLVIIAGGRFHVPSASAFERQRRHFYQAIDWSEPIRAACDEAWAHRPQHVGLHVRQTDRSLEAPTRSAIRAALSTMREQTGIDSLFVAADTDAARSAWLDAGTRLGFVPWTIDHPDTDRSTAAGAVAAMVDWRTLGRSAALVYSAASSFGEEAAVAADAATRSYALVAPTRVRNLRSAGSLLRSAATYPRRRGWLGGRGD